MSTFIGSSEASRLLGVSKPTLYAYVSRGLLPRRTADDGRTSLYVRDDVERLRERSRRYPADRPATIDVEIESAITRISDDGVTYRGHDVATLATRAGFEQVAELLWTGALPDSAPSWPIDRRALERCRRVAEAAGPMDASPLLALAAGVLSTEPVERSADAARRLLAIVPDLLGARRRSGTVASRLASAWHRRPPDALVAAIDRALVLLADHELATSTLGVRVAASVRADAGAALAAGLHVVRGPLHGEASRAAATLLRTATGDVAAVAVRAATSERRRLPGFGHAVYRSQDPRVAPLLDAVRALPDPHGQIGVVDAVLAEAGRTGAGLPNVDLALAALLVVGGLPLDAPVLAIARIAGWAAHHAEEVGEHPLRYRGLTRPRP
jgi:citrate synthase